MDAHRGKGVSIHSLFIFEPFYKLLLRTYRFVKTCTVNQPSSDGFMLLIVRKRTKVFFVIPVLVPSNGSPLLSAIESSRKLSGIGVELYREKKPI